VKHLLSIEQLSKAEIEAILDRAESFAEVGRRDIKKVPTLRGRTVVTLFYESSTRTSSSPPTWSRSRRPAPRSRRASL
jgi:aspartate carbamoyltransferase catalytic subunit